MHKKHVTVASPCAPTADPNTLDDVDAKLADVHEEENKEPKRAVAPANRTIEHEEQQAACCGEAPRRDSHLNAPYSGLYQQTNEHGVKSKNQRMDRPKSTPCVASTQNQDRQAMRLASSVPVWTGRESLLNSFLEKHQTRTLWATCAD